VGGGVSRLAGLWKTDLPSSGNKGSSRQPQRFLDLAKFYCNMFRLKYKQPSFLHSSSPSYDRSEASSKASFPHSAIQSFLLQMRVASHFLKVIQ
jgi:hypothetical protein